MRTVGQRGVSDIDALLSRAASRPGEGTGGATVTVERGTSIIADAGPETAALAQRIMRLGSARGADVDVTAVIHELRELRRRDLIDETTYQARVDALRDRRFRT